MEEKGAADGDHDHAEARDLCASHERLHSLLVAEFLPCADDGVRGTYPHAMSSPVDILTSSRQPVHRHSCTTQVLSAYICRQFSAGGYGAGLVQ